MPPKKEKDSVRQITAAGVTIAVRRAELGDYLSITDIARIKNEDTAMVTANWLRPRSTMEYLAKWEQRHNPSFRMDSYQELYSSTGNKAFTISPKRWIDETGAIGLQSRAGRGGGTYAFVDIAMEFASRVVPGQKQDIAEAYRISRLEENQRWSPNETSSAILSPDGERPRILVTTLALAPGAKDEEIVNAALFGTTSARWNADHPGELPGGLRRNSSMTQMIAYQYLDEMNQAMKKQGVSETERLLRLNRMAIDHVEMLRTSNGVGQIDLPVTVPCLVDDLEDKPESEITLGMA